MRRFVSPQTIVTHFFRDYPIELQRGWSILSHVVSELNLLATGRRLDGTERFTESRLSFCVACGAGLVLYRNGRRRMTENFRDPAGVFWICNPVQGDQERRRCSTMSNLGVKHAVLAPDGRASRQF
jgi:hypothetical protein